MGRRDALLFSCIFWLVGTALQTATTGQGMLIGGRILNGITVGITSSQVPVYLAEVAKHSQRGTIIIIQQLAIEWGILIMYYISYGCSFMDGEKAFRVPWGLQMIPAVILGFGLMFLPESPRWLARHDLRLLEAEGHRGEGEEHPRGTHDEERFAAHLVDHG